MRFTRHIGIDYSGAETPASRLKGLQIYESRNGETPERIGTPTAGARNWTRSEVVQFCASAMESGEPVIIGIDHACSFPMSYMQRFGIESWDRFLDDFMRHWPTADPHTYVDFVREGNPRTGEANELRLCGQWTAGAKSVLRFDVQGQVAMAPWINGREPGGGQVSQPGVAPPPSPARLAGRIRSSRSRRGPRPPVRRIP